MIKEEIIMLEVVPFEPGHLLDIDLIDFQAYMKPMIEKEIYRKMLALSGPAYSGFDENGKLIGVAGVRQLNEKTYHAWGIFSKDLPKHSIAVLKAINLFCKSMFDNQAADRIQADVSMNYPAGIRFAKALKFQPEAIMKYYQQGVDHILYVRTNPWLQDSIL
jgi:RimJ/RimL family protein N-acetyltransferase